MTKYFLQLASFREHNLRPVTVPASYCVDTNTTWAPEIRFGIFDETPGYYLRKSPCTTETRLSWVVRFLPWFYIWFVSSRDYFLLRIKISSSACFIFSSTRFWQLFSRVWQYYNQPYSVILLFPVPCFSITETSYTNITFRVRVAAMQIISVSTSLSAEKEVIIRYFHIRVICCVQLLRVTCT